MPNKDRNQIAKKTIINLHNGDHITDKELIITINQLNPVIKFIDTLNDQRYYLFLKELKDDKNTLDNYLNTRIENKHKLKKIKKQP